MLELCPPTPEDSEEQEGLFEMRTFLGRTVFIIGDLIQPDFTINETEEQE